MEKDGLLECLGIPDNILLFLSGAIGDHFDQPLWTFAKHRSGFGLRLFWKSNNQQPTSPNKAHSVNRSTSHKLRNKTRMDTFLARKKRESTFTTIPGTINAAGAPLALEPISTHSMEQRPIYCLGCTY